MKKTIRQWIALILTALLVFSAAASTAASEEDPQELIDRAAEAWNSGDYEIAADCYRRAADLGYAGALNYLGVMYCNGIGVEQSYEEAIRCWQAAADQGDAVGMLNMAGMYQNGMGVEQSYEKAMEYYTAAAGLGDALGMTWLGIYYENGMGVEPSPEKAAEYYRMAADLGNPTGQIYLACCYRDGTGVGQSYETAMEYLQLVAAQEDDPQAGAVAMTNIGRLYEEGSGVEQSYEKAAEYYQAAADRGEPIAMVHLGMLYEQGNGFGQSYEKAADYYRLATEQVFYSTFPDGFYHLARLYQEGLGVEQSAEKAMELYAIAAGQGSEEAQQEIDRYAAANHYGLVQTEGIVIPDYTQENVKQYEFPAETDAIRFVRNLKAGWNLGNTFDAYRQGVYVPDDYETVWSGAKTTPELIHALKEAGFNLIRIPVSWHDHLIDDDYTISPAWLARVKEVAGWALDEDMYVIINIHHDNAKDYLYPDTEHYEQSEKYLTAIWSQVAEAFAECDEHVIFESMNEPRLVDTEYEWWPDPEIPEVLDAMQCINRLNRKFVETVRASGGNNAERFLLIPGYSGSFDGAYADAFEIPDDDRIIIEVHGYTPYNFALNTESPDSSFDLKKDSNKKSEIAGFINRLYEKFIVNGVPVIIDEFGALKKNDDDLQARVNFAAFYTAMASARGIPVVWWDNSNFTWDGEKFGLIDRNRLEWVYPDIALAIVMNCMVNRGE